MVFNWKQKISKLLSRDNKKTESFSELVNGVKEIREVNPDRAGHHGKKIEVEIKDKDAFSNGNTRFLEKKMDKSVFSKRNLKKWGKRFQELKEVGANVPEFVAPDYERNSLFFKMLSNDKFVDCAKRKNMINALKEDPKAAKEMGRQMALAHKAGFAQERGDGYTPMSSMFLIKQEEGYKPVFADVMNLSKIRNEEERKIAQLHQLKYTIKAQLRPPGEVENPFGEKFKEGYFEKASEIGLDITEEDVEKF